MTIQGRKPAKLAVFDVDGTLTQTYHDDVEAFLGSVRAAFGFEDVSDDWASYTHVTDSGILDQLIRERLGRPAAPEDQNAAEAAYGAVYGAIVAARGVQPVPGAPAFVRRLLAEGDWAVAVASGAWRGTAELRLREAVIAIDPACVATASERMARRDIVELAIRRAVAHWGLADGPEGFARIVLLGDGLWDVRTARDLGFPFVGVGEDRRAARLAAAGARHIVADFADSDAVLALLATAAVPALDPGSG